jgi:hypothetical protein
MTSLIESTAEAFAAWLLMPRSALRYAATCIGAHEATLTSEQVYQISLLLGTTFRGTARHLGVARVVDSQRSTALQRTPLARIKNRFDDASAPARESDSDVWQIAGFIRAGTITIADGDRIVLPESADVAAEHLIASASAEFVHHGADSIILTARARDSPDTPQYIDLGNDTPPLRITIEETPVAPPPRQIPMVADCTPEELDRRLGRR